MSATSRDDGSTAPPPPPTKADPVDSSSDDEKEKEEKDADADDESTILTALDRDLSALERQLDDRRSLGGGGGLGGGRAAYRSVSDALESVRDRVNSLASADASANRNPPPLLSQLSRRLEEARRSHTSRVPLGLVSGSNSELQQSRRDLRGSVLASVGSKRGFGFGRGGDEASASAASGGGAEAGGGGGDDVGGQLGQRQVERESRRRQFQMQREPSGIVASRVRAEQAHAAERSGDFEGFEVSLEGFGAVSTDVHAALPPVEEQSSFLSTSEASDVGAGGAEDEDEDKGRDKGKEHTVETAEAEKVSDGPEGPETETEAVETPEVHVLLTRRQSALPSAANLTGSVLLPIEPSTTGTEPAISTTSACEIYSWGCISSTSSGSAHSLHDTAEPHPDPAASALSAQSRLCRPGAAAILSVSAGVNHAAVATVRGEVLTCGLNVGGCVDPARRSTGEGEAKVEVIERPTHLESLGMNRILSVSCGLDHTAALTSAGAVLTWGSDEYGQLGHRPPFGAAADDVPKSFCRPKALALSGGRRAGSVSCGHGFTLVLTTRMEVLACGRDEITGWQRQRQHDSSSSSSSPARRMGSPIPALANLPLASISAGSRHAVVVTVHGTAFAWGENDTGCCGRPYPKRISAPVEVWVPESGGDGGSSAAEGAAAESAAGGAFPNWGVGRRHHRGAGVGGGGGGTGDPLSLADDVAVSHAACGDGHTVLVTRSGRLLVCGSNYCGQLGLLRLDDDEGGEGEADVNVSPARPVDHPNSAKEGGGGRFVTAEAGVGTTVLLDDGGDVWQMGGGVGGGGGGDSGPSSSGPELVLRDRNVAVIAAGGSECYAIAAPPAGSGAAAVRRQFSVRLDDGTSVAAAGLGGTGEEVAASASTTTLEGLLESVSAAADGGEGKGVSAPALELARRTEELLRYPAVLNGLFLDPTELDDLCRKLVTVGNNAEERQAIANAIERGISRGVEATAGGGDGGGARLMHPEQVRHLLIYVRFFDRGGDDDGDVNDDDNDGDGVVFDPRGTVVSSLCDAILALPYEGARSLLTWATVLHPTRSLYVRMLVRPLLVQLNRGVVIDVDEDGVQHPRPSRRAVPLLAAVLRWLYVASERAGGIADPEDFYSDAVSNLPVEALFKDLHRMKSAEHPGASFHLMSQPFLLSPGAKRNLLQVESQVEMFRVATQDGDGVTFDADTRELTFDPFWKLEIERDHMLEQTLEAIRKAETSDLRKKLAVKFKGEEGVDAGGVTREFFQLICEELFDVSSGMWTDRFGDEITFFNSDCTWDEEGYELTGVLVGLALYNSVLLDVRFPTAVYRKLLGLPLGMEDMVDEELRSGLQQLLDYEGDDVEYIFCLSFEVTWNDMGKEQKVELKPGGSNMPVTSDNREEYVLLYVKWLLVDSIQPQWDAFEKGVMKVMDGSCLDMFRPEELELLVVGTPELDFLALEANTVYEGGFDEDSEVVRNFWKFIKNADRESQIKFLKFSTGSGQAPIGGLGELGFKIQRAGPDSPQLPTSHTCFNTLLLPDYGDDYDKLARQLGRAILECEGFGLQ